MWDLPFPLCQLYAKCRHRDLDLPLNTTNLHFKDNLQEQSSSGVSRLLHYLVISYHCLFVVDSLLEKISWLLTDIQIHDIRSLTYSQTSATLNNLKRSHIEAVTQISTVVFTSPTRDTSVIPWETYFTIIFFEINYVPNPKPVECSLKLCSQNINSYQHYM